MWQHGQYAVTPVTRPSAAALDDPWMSRSGGGRPPARRSRNGARGPGRRPRPTPMQAVLNKFANDTSMHGVPKVITARSPLSRCFWSLVCIAAGAMFCMQMAVVMRRYFSYPKKVTVEVVPAPVPFPAVSICNMRNLDFHILNEINRKFLADPHLTGALNASTSQFVREYLRTVRRYAPLWYEYQETYPLVFKELFSRTTFSSNIAQSVISSAAVNLDEFIVNCRFGGRQCDLRADFTTFFDPYYFNCFTYRRSDDIAELGKYPLSEGVENGWSSVVFSGNGLLDRNDDIRVLPGLHESQSPVSASEGVRVVIHPPDTQPFPFTEGFDVPPGFSASFGIRPRRNERIGQPYGNCTDSDPFDRQPVDATGQQAPAPPHQRYRGMACQKRCLQAHIVRACNCTDSSLPVRPGGRVVSCRRCDEIPASCENNATRECLAVLLRFSERIECARRTREAAQKNSTLLQLCGCYPPCTEVYYDVSYSLSRWPAAGYEGDAAYYDVIYIDRFKERFVGTPKYNIVAEYFVDEHRERSMKDFARLNVYIADSNVIITVESPDYQSSQLVSDIGGQLGLWVGISVITLAEVFQLFGVLFRFVLPLASYRYQQRRRQQCDELPAAAVERRADGFGPARLPAVPRADEEPGREAYGRGTPRYAQEGKYWLW